MPITSGLGFVSVLVGACLMRCAPFMLDSVPGVPVGLAAGALGLAAFLGGAWALLMGATK